LSVILQCNYFSYDGEKSTGDWIHDMRMLLGIRYNMVYCIIKRDSEFHYSVTHMRYESYT